MTGWLLARVTCPCTHACTHTHKKTRAHLCPVACVTRGGGRGTAALLPPCFCLAIPLSPPTTGLSDSSSVLGGVLCRRDFNVVSYTLLLTLIEFKTLVMREQLSDALALLPSIPTGVRTCVPRFLPHVCPPLLGLPLAGLCCAMCSTATSHPRPHPAPPLPFDTPHPLPPFHPVLHYVFLSAYQQINATVWRASWRPRACCRRHWT